jgi:hypothetical protein
MKLGAKWAELVQLMQKFVSQSRVGIVRNTSTQSIPLDTKLMFWCISQCLGAFGIILLLHETWCKMGRTGAIKVKFRALSRVGIFQNERTRFTPLDLKLIFLFIS